MIWILPLNERAKNCDHIKEIKTNAECSLKFLSWKKRLGNSLDYKIEMTSLKN